MNIFEKSDLHVKYFEDNVQQRVKNYIQVYFTIS